jgi:PAS domain S-box-containing protein
MTPDTFPNEQCKTPNHGELFNFLLEHIPDLIFFKDRNSRFICVNHAVLDLFGVKRQEDVIGKTDFDFQKPEDARRTLKDEQCVLQTGEPIREHVSKKAHPDGTPFWVLTTKLPLRNDRGDIVGTCGISKDITLLKEAEEALARTNKELEKALAELKATQAQLISAEKARSVARLASGIAHEVRNPLNILATGLDFLSSETIVISNPALPVVLQEMRDAIRRADNVVSTLMESPSLEGLRLEATNVNALIERVVAAMGGKIEQAGVKVTTRLAAGFPLIKAYKQKFSQVLESIIDNALDAMPGGGDLRICTRLEELTPDAITRDAGARGGQVFRAGDQVVTVEIADTGTGIPEEVLPRIFDPFFTTKDPGVKSGLGLGLTVCRAIIELHDGSLEIANREDCRGVRATLKFKRQQEAVS